MLNNLRFKSLDFMTLIGNSCICSRCTNLNMERMPILNNTINSSSPTIHLRIIIHMAHTTNNRKVTLVTLMELPTHSRRTMEQQLPFNTQLDRIRILDSNKIISKPLKMSKSDSL